MNTDLPVVTILRRHREEVAGIIQNRQESIHAIETELVKLREDLQTTDIAISVLENPDRLHPPEPEHEHEHEPEYEPEHEPPSCAGSNGSNAAPLPERVSEGDLLPPKPAFLNGRYSKPFVQSLDDSLELLIYHFRLGRNLFDNTIAYGNQKLWANTRIILTVFYHLGFVKMIRLRFQVTRHIPESLLHEAVASLKRHSKNLPKRDTSHLNRRMVAKVSGWAAQELSTNHGIAPVTNLKEITRYRFSRRPKHERSRKHRTDTEA